MNYGYKTFLNYSWSIHVKQLFLTYNTYKYPPEHHNPYDPKVMIFFYEGYASHGPIEAQPIWREQYPGTDGIDVAAVDDPLDCRVEECGWIVLVEFD